MKRFDERSLSPEVMRRLMRDPALRRLIDPLGALRPAGIDLVVHNPQIVIPSRSPLRLQLFFPISNFGKTASVAGVYVQLLAGTREEIANREPRYLVNRTLPALTTGAMDGIGVEITTPHAPGTDPAILREYLRSSFHQVSVRLLTSSRPKASEFRDADNPNHTRDLSGSELVTLSRI